MNSQIDMQRVRMALARYGKNPKKKRENHAPADAALRKPLLKRSDKCSGFYCRDFLHGH